MNFDDEKDLQQILFLAGRILERQHLQHDERPTLPPLLSDDGKTIFFPGSRADRKEPPHGAAVSQKEVSLTFSKEEISKMPKSFRKIFRTDHKTAHVRLKPSGIYEIRIQINGTRISASGKFLEDAKARFIEKLRLFCSGERKTPERHTISPPAAPAGVLLSVSDYAFHYLETFKRNNISEKHYYNLCGVVRRHIARFFAGKLMRDITATDCQKFLNELTAAGKGRTAEEAKNILSWISAAAVADRILPADVMPLVHLLPHRRNAGKVIPRELVRTFLAKEPASRAELCLWLLLYTGMRPCELYGLSFDSPGFVIIQTAKKKKWEAPETRKIPLHPALIRYIDRIRSAVPVALVLLERAFRAHFPPDYRLYDLRHTFTTAAQEAHCYKSWVDYITGHKAGGNTTDRVYTHWEDDFQREEIAKLEY